VGGNLKTYGVWEVLDPTQERESVWSALSHPTIKLALFILQQEPGNYLFRNKAGALGSYLFPKKGTLDPLPPIRNLSCPASPLPF